MRATYESHLCDKKRPDEEDEEGGRSRARERESGNGHEREGKREGRETETEMSGCGRSRVVDPRKSGQQLQKGSVSTVQSAVVVVVVVVVVPCLRYRAIMR
jgi:hypothetical protein